MKFINVDDAQALVFAETTMPDIAADECLVKVKAIGVNRADILQRAGKYPPPKGESLILGIEVSGEIVACGDQVTNKAVGDKVCGLVPGGGYAEYVRVNADHLIDLPPHYEYVQGAALAETFLTAYQCLFIIASLQPNENVLIHAGASGVGTAAIQLAKAKQAYVVVTTSNQQKAQACLDLGADEVINYKDTDFAAYCKDKALSFNVIIDVVAGDYLNKNVNIAALDGRIVILSMLGGHFSKQLDVAKLLMKRLTITATTLRNRSDDYKSQLVGEFLQQFSALLSDDTITPVIDRTLPWQQAEQAHQILMTNQNIGKVVLTLD
ncbi:NAD(P)H quinone oxidoreductase [Thalassotalea insulae]|uniref:NAD(P)H quinone oxidoreductase n=1 Tax=Thalassotalea insulae TaxID=2056778 RepID=A0ABQ6GYX1_9GAMM|nr:NAD(P)H-quinone oxidoreductase [Thalassotalea insulae]GLX80439.1 NAD(P)H quinone oxidoreductase [Thalassotalea insulae]